MPWTIRFSSKGLAFIRQLLATLTAAWTCVGHGLLTGYTAQAIPSMSKADSRIEMTETHKNWISKYVKIFWGVIVTVKNFVKLQRQYATITFMMI